MDDDNASPSAPSPPPPSAPPPPTQPELSYTTIPLNTPATEIRLLELFPSAVFSSPLHCRLYNTPISSPAPFKALSYAWGSDDKTHLIYIDSNNTSDNGNDADVSAVNVSSDDRNGEEANPDPGTTPSKSTTNIIRITSSLDTCLRHLRAIHHRDHPSTILTLWIDQLCIDQSNPDEKAVQVGLMSQIYSRAKQVLIWLGPAADGSDEVMDALAELGREFGSVGVSVADAHMVYEVLNGLVYGGDGEGGGAGVREGTGTTFGDDKVVDGPEADGSDEVLDALAELGRELESVGMSVGDAHRLYEVLNGLGYGGDGEGGGAGVREGTGTTFGDDKVVDGPEADGSDEVMDALVELGRELESIGMSLGNRERLSEVMEFLIKGGDGDGVGSDLGVGVGVADTEALDKVAVACTTNKADASTGKTVMAVVEDGAARLLRLGVSGELQAFFRRPWFTRVWVVQEACQCADTVFVCGTKPPVSYDICGAIALCTLRPLREFWLKDSISYSPEWDISTDVEIAGVWMPRDVARALFGLVRQVFYSFTGRDSRLQQIMEGEGGDDLFTVLVDMYMNVNIHPSREAKLYRDRVYGLLGVAADVDDLEIKPDYSSQTRTAQILTEVAKAIIGKTKDGFPVELLSYSQFPKTILDDGSDEQLPSWVPDWRPGLQPPFYSNLTDEEIIPYERDGNATPDTYTACGTHRSVELLATPAPEVLGLRGYLVDIIEEVGSLQCDPHKLDDDEEEEYFREVMDPFFSHLDRLWELSKQKNEPIYETSARRQEALWRVPIVDTASKAPGEKSKSRAGSASALHYQQLRHVQKQLQLICPSPDAEFPTEVTDEVMQWAYEFTNEILGSGGVGAREYIQHFGYIVAEKTLYMTQKGYLGMGPHEMKSGDVVAVFPRARIPFVLRPTAEEDTFTYVGDAYCDGIMDGEITLREEKRNFFIV